MSSSNACNVVIEGKQISLTPAFVVCTWAELPSLKSYRNQMKKLRSLEMMASVSSSIQDVYACQTMINLSQDQRLIYETLKDREDSFPAGYQIEWPALQRFA